MMKGGVVWVALLLGFISLSGCGLFGSEKNTRPPISLKPIKPTLVVEKIWTAHVGDGNGGYFLRLKPYISNQVLYAASYDGHVVAINLKSGAHLWSINIGHHLVGGVSGGEGMLFVGGQDGMLFGVNLKRRNVLWKTRLSSKVISISNTSGNVVIAHVNDGKLFAINTSTGNINWTYSYQEHMLIMHGKSQPIINSGLVISGFSDGKLIAFNISDGSTVWALKAGEPSGPTEVQQLDGVDGRIIIADGLVFAAPYHGNAVAVQASNGQILWTHPMTSYAGLAVNKGAVFITDAGSDIWALDRSDGASLWRQGGLHFREVTAPTVVGQSIVVGDFAGYLQWMSTKTGAFVARERVDSSGIQAAPIAIGKVVYVQTAAGTLAAYRVLRSVGKVRKTTKELFGGLF